LSVERSLQVVDYPGAGAPFAELQRRLERDRAEARRRYRQQVSAVLYLHDEVEDSDRLAEAVLDALTPPRRGGGPCRCGCHPQLPESAFHDFGFDCPCTHTPEQRRRDFEDFRTAEREFWSSPAGRRIVTAEEAEEAALAEWVAAQADVVLYEHGGACPEQWVGEVGGRSFGFRERHGEWRVELDLHPRSRIVDTFAGLATDGEPRLTPREIDEGGVIATGTVEVEDYGETLVERARFILGLIRTHVARTKCQLHAQGFTDVEESLGVPVRWCPACGASLNPLLDSES